jgi:hypothetical protein
MVRILGSSSERVVINDLKDVIYYRQLKEYTDQEFQASRDLQRARQEGRITVLEQAPTPRGSVGSGDAPPQVSSNSGLSVGDLKAALRELLPEMKMGGGVSGEDLRGAVRDIAPMIVEMVRQEVSRISVSGGARAPVTSIPTIPVYVGPEYIPSVSTEGMVGNIEVKSTEMSAAGVEDSFAALRRLKSIP